VSGQPVGLPWSDGGFDISSDGRYVAFSSDKPDVVPGDATSQADVFLRDLVTGSTTLVSRPIDGEPAAGDSTAPLFAGASRYLFFASDAPNLTPSPGDGRAHVYRYDVLSGALDRVAAPVDGPFRVSDDGNVVAFPVVSREDFNLLVTDVFVHDFAAGVTALGSARASGQPLKDPATSLPFALSGDGGTLVFVTRQAGVTPDDTNGSNSDVFARDLAGGTTSLVSVLPAGANSDSDSDYPSVSADGRFVCFQSAAALTGRPPLRDPPFGTSNDVFVRDLRAGATRLVSADPTGDFEAGGYFPEMSADGRFVAYLNDNPGTTADDTATSTDRLVLRDLAAGAVTLINRDAGGAVFDMANFRPHKSFDRSGTLLTFSSGSDADVPRFVPGVVDENLRTDLLAVQVAPTPAYPAASAAAADLSAAAPSLRVDVTYIGAAIVARTISAGDVFLAGPNGIRVPGTLAAVQSGGDGPRNVATYLFDFPGGISADDNGAYTVEMVAGEVLDTRGLAVPAGPVPGGSFDVSIPATGAADLRVLSFTGTVPPLVRGEAFAARPLRLRVENSGDRRASGRVALHLLASADGVADAGDVTVARITDRKINLGPGRTLQYTFGRRALSGLTTAPLPDGAYRLIAVVDADDAIAESQEANNVAVRAEPLTVAAPFSDVGIASPSLPGRPAPGRKATLLFTARNEGNAVARGVQPARVRLTAAPANPAAVSRTFDVPLKLNLKPGATKALRAKLTLPGDLPAGTYFLVVELLDGAPWDDPDASDNGATGAATYTV
jgi:Tol biopolymer transport system component